MLKCQTCLNKSALPKFPEKCYYCTNETKTETSACSTCSDSKKVCAICHKGLA